MRGYGNLQIRKILPEACPCKIYDFALHRGIAAIGKQGRAALAPVERRSALHRLLTFDESHVLDVLPDF